MTAENVNDLGDRRAVIARGFNEAAADDRGKLTLRSVKLTGRPRFNEAAADDRGKPTARRPRRSRRSGFNEAAADDRGKRLLGGRLHACTHRRFNEAAADDRGKRAAAPSSEEKIERLQ